MGNFVNSKVYSGISTVEKVLLLATGITLPFLTLRIQLPVYTITFYLLFMGILMVYFYIKKLKLEKKSMVFYKNKEDILILLFFLIMTISLLYSVDQAYAVAKWTKFLIAIIFYFLLKTILVEKPLYFEKISKYAAFALPFYIGLLGYYYLIVFNADYIGMELQYQTRTGKNSLAFMVCIVIAFSLSYAFENLKTKTYIIIRLLMFTFLIVGVVLIQSRGLFLILCAYFIIYLLLKKMSARILLKISLIIFALFLLGSIFISEDIKQSVVARFSSLLIFVDNDYVIEDTGTSIAVRGNLVERGIELLSESPIFGVGLGSFMTYGGSQSPISHNDYMLVLSEQGLIGFLFFLLFIASFIKLAYINFKRQNTPTNQGLFLSMCGISFYLLFINAYDNILLWTIISAIAATDIKLRSSS